MITLRELKSNIERQTLLEKTDEWFPVNDDWKFMVGDEVRTPDGLVKVVATHNDSSTFYGKIITPIHDDVLKGETYEYRSYETQVLSKKKDKRLVKTVKDVMKKSKQQNKDDDLLQIDDSKARHKSPAIHNPIVINPVLEIFGSVLSKKEIKDLTNTNGNSIKEGLSDSMARGLALAVKRKAMVLGKSAQQEQDIEKKLSLMSRQISAVAALALLATSVSGEGLLSKAGIVSGLFSG
jgi:hypothetical protein